MSEDGHLIETQAVLDRIKENWYQISGNIKEMVEGHREDEDSYFDNLADINHVFGQINDMSVKVRMTIQLEKLFNDIELEEWKILKKSLLLIDGLLGLQRSYFEANNAILMDIINRHQKINFDNRQSEEYCLFKKDFDGFLAESGKAEKVIAQRQAFANYLIECFNSRWSQSNVAKAVEKTQFAGVKSKIGCSKAGKASKLSKAFLVFATFILQKNPNATEGQIWIKSEMYTSDSPFETDFGDVYRDRDDLFDTKGKSISKDTFMRNYLRPLKKR